ncbi:MAG: hypothetical protein R3F41_07490 [Gammaproteobacteria bacterium]|nr:hypothetical protein [Pseudomonadales bacterium]MCP5348766.1 hypothetical protein [Pseudomonadales bacterium]
MSSFRLKSTVSFLAVLGTAALITGHSYSQDPDRQLDLSATLFKCLTEMAKVDKGDFFVDNLLGDLDATLAVANSDTGGSYPPGSVVSLIPAEVMVKHREGWNPATNDWEFIELNLADGEPAFSARGTTEVVNQFGGNCFGCHQLARPEWDLICASDHGCAPLPVPREALLGMQARDPRCTRED